MRSAMRRPSFAGMVTRSRNNTSFWARNILRFRRVLFGQTREFHALPTKEEIFGIHVSLLSGGGARRDGDDLEAPFLAEMAAEITGGHCSRPSTRTSDNAFLPFAGSDCFLNPHSFLRLR